MLNKRVGSLALVLITVAAAGLYGCGSDDDTVASGGSGGGGASGSAGKGGSSGSAGKAGSGGNAGSGTAGAEAGAAGSSAGATGDEGGMGGALPGTGGVAGESEGGAGGEAGGGAFSITAACTTICAAQSGLPCTLAECMDNCVGFEGATVAPPEEYDAMIACEAQHLTAPDYECSVQSPRDTVPAPNAGTTCEPAICKWTCDDATFVDANIYARCGC